GGGGGVVAGVEQAIVVEGRGKGGRREECGSGADQEGPAAARDPSEKTVMPLDRSALRSRDTRSRHASGQVSPRRRRCLGRRSGDAPRRRRGARAPGESRMLAGY